MGGMLSLETARGAMRLVSEASYGSLFQSLGVTREDYSLCTGSAPWTGLDRQRVRQTLDAFSAGIMDLVGVARFEMPAEYLAAVVATFVHPTNMMVACRWLENQRPADYLQGASSTPITVDPAEIFCLVCDLMDDERASKVRSSFEKRVGVAQSKSVEQSPK